MAKNSSVSSLAIFCLLISPCQEKNESPQIPPVGSIQGRVTDSTGHTKISGALVTTSPPTSAVSTESHGNYRITDVPAGQYTLIASKGGQGSGSVTISVASGKTTTADIHLNSAYPVPTVVFEDHFNNSSSLENWSHTTDYRGGGQFQVVKGQFARTKAGHVFYYNKRFKNGYGIYEFNAKGRWVFFWRGTTENPTHGKALALAVDDSLLYYLECNWNGFVYGYHNGVHSRRETANVGQLLLNELNLIRIIDTIGTARIYVNNELKLNLVISDSFLNLGYIEIGANYQPESTLFDDIVVTRY